VAADDGWVDASIEPDVAISQHVAGGRIVVDFVAPGIDAYPQLETSHRYLHFRKKNPIANWIAIGLGAPNLISLSIGIQGTVIGWAGSRAVIVSQLDCT
jgi:hypothetical protein